MAFELLKARKYDANWGNVVVAIPGTAYTGLRPNVFGALGFSQDLSSTQSCSSAVTLFGKNCIIVPNTTAGYAGICTNTNSLLSHYQRSFTVEGNFRIANYSSTTSYLFQLSKTILSTGVSGTGGSTGTDLEIGLIINSSGVMLIKWYENGGYAKIANNTTMDVSTTLSLATWYFVALCYDYPTSTLRVWVNGVLVYTKTSVTVDQSAVGCVHFGSPWNWTNANFSLIGYMGNLRYTNVAKYNVSCPVPTSHFGIEI